MSAPTPGRHPGSSQSGPSGGPRRRRNQLVLAASALVVLAVAVGASLAVATRPIDRQAAAQASTGSPTAADDQNANAGQDQAAQPDQGTTADPPAAPVLEDGDHPAYITKVDSANDRVVVDVVQVFSDGEAVKAAIADGEIARRGQVPHRLGPQREPAAAHPAPGRRPQGRPARHLRGVRQRPRGGAHQAGRQRQAQGQLLLRADRLGRDGGADPGAAGHQRLLTLAYFGFQVTPAPVRSGDARASAGASRHARPALAGPLSGVGGARAAWHARPRGRVRGDLDGRPGGRAGAGRVGHRPGRGSG